MKTTTIEIYFEDVAWWTACKKLKNMTSPELFRGIKTACDLKKQAEFYLTLSKPVKYIKPLSGVKIKKNYRK